jgi:hypothetical protein
MKRRTHSPSFFSKVLVETWTVVPRGVCGRLRLKPGDILRYRLTAEGVLLDKAQMIDVDDPFAAFSEWWGEADEKAYRNL